MTFRCTVFALLAVVTFRSVQSVRIACCGYLSQCSKCSHRFVALTIPYQQDFYTCSRFINNGVSSGSNELHLSIINELPAIRIDFVKHDGLTGVRAIPCGFERGVLRNAARVCKIDFD